jgi:hypothetical protein
MREDELIQSMNRYNASVFTWLGERLHESPKETWQLIIALLASEKLRDDIAIAVDLMRLLVSRFGSRHVEEWILAEWTQMPRIQRRRVMGVFQDAQLLSTEFAQQLFYSSSSGVAEKHGILAALAASARLRHCENLVVELTKQVGEYQDAARQAVLVEFVRSVLSSFVPQDSDSGPVAPGDCSPRAPTDPDVQNRNR